MRITQRASLTENAFEPLMLLISDALGCRKRA